MTIEERVALGTELDGALERLESALREAASAAADLRQLSPRVRSIDTLVQQIESALSNGRGETAAAPPAPSRPTLVPRGTASPTGSESAPIPPAPVEARPPIVEVAPPAVDQSPPTMIPQQQASVQLPPAPQLRPAPQLQTAPHAQAAPQPQPAPQAQAVPQLQPTDGEALTSFRLEFESHPGPLDLRAVDEAVSEHPAVRDVALLDYDGRKATLKVWIAASARPTDVQDALRERTSQLFPADAVVKVLALNGVA